LLDAYLADELVGYAVWVDGDWADDGRIDDNGRRLPTPLGTTIAEMLADSYRDQGRAASLRPVFAGVAIRRTPPE
jgi:hypothetical protein